LTTRFCGFSRCSALASMSLWVVVMHADEHPSIREHAQPPGSEYMAGTQLHVCAYCSGEFVHPLDWIEEDSSRWRIVLRCPECEALSEGVFSQPVVDVFADELDRGETELLCALRQMTRENMTETVARFVRALDADLILPSDF
jgi:hypothetical protein